MHKSEDISLALSVVIPCYNESDGLHALYQRVKLVCSEYESLGYEIVLVNDGSTDDSWAVMRELSLSDPHLLLVNLSRNHGHQLALSAGLRICRGQRILIIDADLQDPPELLPAMMLRMDLGVDVVYGQRISREGETAFKKLSAFAFYRFLRWVVDIDIPADTGDFRLISRRALDVLNAMPEHNRFIRGMVSWIGFTQEAFPYERDSRLIGETKYPLSRMMKLALDAITGFSVRPLKLASYLGIIFGTLALVLLGYVIVSYLNGRNVDGWTSLATIILALGSFQLFAIGLFGEYLGRLYIESKNRPLYIVQDIVRSSSAATSSPKENPHE